MIASLCALIFYSKNIFFEKKLTILNLAFNITKEAVLIPQSPKT